MTAVKVSAYFFDTLLTRHVIHGQISRHDHQYLSCLELNTFAQRDTKGWVKKSPVEIYCGLFCVNDYPFQVQ